MIDCIARGYYVEGKCANARLYVLSLIYINPQPTKYGLVDIAFISGIFLWLNKLANEEYFEHYVLLTHHSITM